MREIPEAAVDLICKWEGLKLKAYLCSAGVPTIGYGHIHTVKLGDTTTKEQAKVWLREDLRTARSKLYSVLAADVIEELSENQWSVLLSFTFNLGFNKSWQIAKHINARRFDQVPAQLMRFVNAGGKKVQGLVNRRSDEARLWLTDNGDTSIEHVPSSVTRGVGVTPPTPTDPTPIAQSKTMWTAGAMTVGGAIEGVKQVQALAAPQAQNSEWVAQIASLSAFLIVAGGIAIMVFRWLDKRKSRL